MRKKSIMALILCATILCTGIAASANGLVKDIVAQLNSEINIKINGQDYALKNGSGEVVSAITYNGTTYIPVRSCADIIGLGATWDPSTQTVYLGEAPKIATAKTMGFSQNYDEKTGGPTGTNTVFKASNTAQLNHYVYMESVKQNTTLTWKWHYNGELIQNGDVTTQRDYNCEYARSVIKAYDGPFLSGTYSVEVTGTYNGHTIFAVTDTFSVE